MFLRMHPELQNDIGKLVSHLLHGTCHLTGSWHRCMQKTICSIASQTASVHQMSHCNGVCAQMLHRYEAHMRAIIGSPYSRSPLRVHTYNWTSTDMLFHGRKFWKLFPPEQDKYLYPDQGSTGPTKCSDCSTVLPFVFVFQVACYLGLLCNVDCTHLLWMPSCQTTRGAFDPGLIHDSHTLTLLA